MKKINRVAFVVAVVGMLAMATAYASEWTKMGSNVFLFTAKQDVIKVKSDDAVSKIRFEDNGDPIRLLKATITFQDGSTQAVDFNNEYVRPGLSSQEIAIDGGPKAIKSVEMTYASGNTRNNGRATIKLYGVQ